MALRVLSPVRDQAVERGVGRGRVATEHKITSCKMNASPKAAPVIVITEKPVKNRVTKPAISPIARSGRRVRRSCNRQRRSEEHTSELQSRGHLVCRLLLEKKKGKSNS